MLRLAAFAAAVVMAAGVAFAGATTTARPVTPIWAPPVHVLTVGRTGFNHELQTVDLNGDGLRDVVIGMIVFDRIEPVPPLFLLNRGGGRFVDATQSLFEGAPPAVEWNRQQVIADFNGDRRPDIFIADTGTDNIAINPGWPGQQNKLILSTPSGKLRDATGNLPQRFTFTHSAAAADVNGDGAVDIFENNLSCCGRSRAEAMLLLNDGAGRFTPAPGLVQGVPRSQYGDMYSLACAFADVNGDGSPDLVLGATEQSGPSVVLVNDGRGNFRPFESLPPKLIPGSGLVIDMAPADIDGDGDPDLLFAETPNDPYYIGTRVQVLVNDGRGHFTDETARRFPQQTDARSWPDRLLVEDFDDDGLPDLAVQHAPPGIIPEPDATPFWLNRGGVFERIAGALQGTSARSRGMVGFVNGAGPHAFLSIDVGGIMGVYLSRQFVAPAAPKSVRAIGSRTGIRLSWRGVQDVDRYEIWRGRPPVRVGSTLTITFDDKRAPRGKALRYRIRAVNAAGAGAFSAEVVGRRR